LLNLYFTTQEEKTKIDNAKGNLKTDVYTPAELKNIFQINGGNIDKILQEITI